MRPFYFFKVSLKGPPLTPNLNTTVSVSRCNHTISQEVPIFQNIKELQIAMRLCFEFWVGYNCTLNICVGKKYCYILQHFYSMVYISITSQWIWLCVCGTSRSIHGHVALWEQRVCKCEHLLTHSQCPRAAPEQSDKQGTSIPWTHVTCHRTLQT